jgi:hypothetical protein
MQLYRLILSICLLDWAVGQIVYYGKCPDLKPVDNFDLQKVFYFLFLEILEITETSFKQNLVRRYLVRIHEEPALLHHHGLGTSVRNGNLRAAGGRNLRSYQQRNPRIVRKFLINFKFNFK